jgi:hypothetical protein
MLKTKSTILILTILFSSLSSFANQQCSSLLESRRGQFEAFSRVDVEAIEFFAAIALSTAVANGEYSSVPSIKMRKFQAIPKGLPFMSKEYEHHKYPYSKISYQDREAMIKDLPEMVYELANESTLDSDLKDRWNTEFLEGFQNRTDTWIKDFIRDNLHAIVFNAAKMPKVNFFKRLKISLVKKWGKSGLIAIIGGFTLEALLPGVFNDFSLGILSSYEYLSLPFSVRSLHNAVPVYATVAVFMNYKDTKSARFKLNVYDTERGVLKRAEQLQSLGIDVKREVENYLEAKTQKMAEDAVQDLSVPDYEFRSSRSGDSSQADSSTTSETD